MANNSEDAAAFDAVISWLVALKEKHPKNHGYFWCIEDLAHIWAGLSFMGDPRQIAFMERFKNYQIVKALVGDTPTTH